MDNINLVNNIDATIELISNGKEWVDKSLPREEKKFPLLRLRRLTRKLNKLKIASQQRPAVAVFGPSQAGKSYMVSNLVKSASDFDLEIQDPLSSEVIHFIQEMNPAGGKESTGCVTRFTTATGSNKGFKLKLLKPKDIVCIIINGYFVDIKDHHFELDTKEVLEILNSFNTLSKDRKNNIFLEDDIYEIKDYVNNNLNLSKNQIIRDLSYVNFWDRAAAIAPYIPIGKVSLLFSFLWGKQPFLDEVFNKLLFCLQSLDFSYTVFCNKQALVPNNKTILDVERVRELYVDIESNTLEVNLENENSRNIDRRLLSALVAEVELNIEKPQNKLGEDSKQYLNYADVLDFPGARSREEIPEKVFEANSDETKLQLFVRGKVSYLFDLYNQDFGISTLLYCMADGNPEVQTIPELLYGWISNSIGTSPDERQQRLENLKKIIKGDYNFDINPLLVILTKFDIELAGKPKIEVNGKPDTHNGKWIARIEENFKNFMIRPLEDKWVDNWILNKPFSNVFPLRDPSYTTIFETANGIETAIRSNHLEKMSDMRVSFVNHDAVKNHVYNPHDFWDAIAKPQATGVEYIIRHLSPTCKPEVKFSLIKDALKSTILQAYSFLKEYYNPEDVEELLEKAKKEGINAFLYLTKLAKQNKFGEFLESLIISEEEAYMCYHQTQNAPVDSDSLDNDADSRKILNVAVSYNELLESFGIDTNCEPSDIILQLQNLLDVNREELEDSIQESIGITLDDILGINNKTISNANNDIALVYSNKIIAKWINKVQEIKNDGKEPQGKKLNKIIDELIKIRKKTRLHDVLYEEIKEEVSNFAVNSKYDIVARITFQIINNFVNTFGWGLESLADRPKNKQGHILFDKDIIDYNAIIPTLDDGFSGKQLFSDWVWGAKEAFTTNVLNTQNIKDTTSIESNRELGRILDNIKNKENAL